MDDYVDWTALDGFLVVGKNIEEDKTYCESCEKDGVVNAIINLIYGCGIKSENIYVYDVKKIIGQWCKPQLPR